MNYGFIYCLGNEAMPGVYKIGMTDRAPSTRAGELSSSTSSPMPFKVLCFAEVEDARSVEATLHAHFHSHRVNHGREFFRCRYSRLAAMINDCSSLFVESSEAVEIAESDRLFDAFMAEQDLESRVSRLLDGARFQGVRIWNEAGEVRFRGEVSPHSWVFGAMFGLRNQMAPFLPTEEPTNPFKRQPHLSLVEGAHL